MKMTRISLRRRDGGFAYVATVILLVVMAGLGVAVVRLNASQVATSSSTVLTARAGQAARGGLEWTFYQLRTKGVSGCAGATTLTDFQADTGFKVTVGCSVTGYNEGQNPSDGTPLVKNLYQVSAVACNGTAAACPDNAGSAAPDYIERRRVATICITAAGNDCY